VKPAVARDVISDIVIHVLIVAQRPAQPRRRARGPTAPEFGRGAPTA
jgi:hypothetical protein